jgi:hypothetical protein
MYLIKIRYKYPNKINIEVVEKPIINVIEFVHTKDPALIKILEKLSINSNTIALIIISDKKKVKFFLKNLIIFYIKF